MIDCTRFCFAAPPGVGVSWFLRACAAAGLCKRPQNQRNQRYQVYLPFPDRSPDDTLRVSLVRHPCDWLAHQFAFPSADLIQNHDVSFARLRRSTFNNFVTDYLDSMPGGVGGLFSVYEADSVMRIEDMPQAFFELLKSLGVTSSAGVPTSRGLSLSPQSAKSGLHLPRWDSMLRRQVIEAEKEVTQHYDYW